MFIKQTFHQNPILSNLPRHTLNNLDDNQMLTKFSQHCFTWANTLGKSNFNIGLTLPITRRYKFTKYLELKTHQQIVINESLKNILFIKGHQIGYVNHCKVGKTPIGKFSWHLWSHTHEHITSLGKFDQSMDTIQKTTNCM